MVRRVEVVGSAALLIVGLFACKPGDGDGDGDGDGNAQETPQQQALELTESIVIEAPHRQGGPGDQTLTNGGNDKKRVSLSFEERVRDLEQRLETVKRTVMTSEELDARYCARLGKLEAELADTRTRIRSMVTNPGNVDRQPDDEVKKSVARIEERADEIARQVGA